MSEMETRDVFEPDVSTSASFWEGSHSLIGYFPKRNPPPKEKNVGHSTTTAVDLLHELVYIPHYI